MTTQPQTDPTRRDVFAANLHLQGLDGRLVSPRDADWDDARTPWQLAVDQRPEAVVLAASPRDVVATVRAAAVAGLAVAPQSTGHNAAPLGDLAGTVLLRTSGLRDVEIDPERRTARVGAGAVWEDVTAAAAKYGLTGLAGSARDVGVVGYTLGGGLSFLARAHGLASDHVVAADVVTAGGRLLRVDADHEPDLFWAVRGGNAAGAVVVTALEFTLLPITEVYAGALFFPIEQADAAFTAWRDLLPVLPDEITSTARLLRFPPLPDLPDPLRGRSFAVLQFVSLLDAAGTDAVVAPLRALAPTLDTLRPTTTVELGDLNMDPPAPVPATGDGGSLAALPAEAVEALLTATGPDSEFSLMSVELRHLGGALAPGRITGRGALDGLPGEVVWFVVGITPDPTTVLDAAMQIDRVRDALAPWTADRGYGNFAEMPRPASTLYDDATLQRLCAVKATYDPTDLIRAHHPVGRD
jgi:FAD/FMN-containing dehydrogenase